MTPEELDTATNLLLTLREVQGATQNNQELAFYYRGQTLTFHDLQTFVEWYTRRLEPQSLD